MTGKPEDKIELEDEIECPDCMGQGFIETEEEGTVDCPECDGNGTISP